MEHLMAVETSLPMGAILNICEMLLKVNSFAADEEF